MKSARRPPEERTVQAAERSFKVANRGKELVRDTYIFWP
jgi:hypothetical protein